MISIGIPFHNETKEDVKYLFKSLDNQIGIDFNNFEVLLCNDMKETAPLETETFDEYPNLKNILRFFKQPYERSPGMSRQTCIDNARGEYILFCDCDDALSDILALRTLEENIKKTHVDMYNFLFLEEIKSKNEDPGIYSLKTFNSIWVFPKAYRIEFLRENNIRFCEKLHWHEDTYFNILFNSYNPRIQNVEKIIYIWKFAEKSVTRLNDHEYTFNSRDEFLQSVDYAYTASLAHDPSAISKIKNDALIQVVHTYLLLSNPRFMGVSKEVRERVENAYIRFALKYTPEVFADQYHPSLVGSIAAIQNGVNETTFLPELTFVQFNKVIKGKYNINVEK